MDGFRVDLGALNNAAEGINTTLYTLQSKKISSIDGQQDDYGTRAAAVPDEVQFVTKEVLAQMMLGHALDARVPLTGWSPTRPRGQDHKFRTCERRRIGYIVAVPRSQTTPSDAGSDWADMPPRHPSRRSNVAAPAREPKAHGCSTEPWSRSPRGERTPPGWGRWLLLRRQIRTPDQTDAGKQPELAYYLRAGAPGTTDEDWIRVTGALRAFQMSPN